MGFLLDLNDKNKISASKSTCWESDIDIIKACGKAPSTVTVSIKPNAKDKIERLMTKFEHTEWLAYLIGKENIVEDIYIPKQVVSSGSVTNIDSSICNKLPVIGVIHSHHTMGNSFSKTDDDWINQNNDISLCISNNGINGQVRWKTPCGSLMIVNAVVKIELNIDYDIEEFEKQIKDNIKEDKIVNSFCGKSYDVNRFSNVGRFDDCKVISKKKENMTLEEELKYLEESGMYIFDNDGDDVAKDNDYEFTDERAQELFF